MASDRPLPTDVRVALTSPVTGLERRETGARLARWFTRAGYAPAATLHAMDPYRAVCDPPMTVTELAALVTEAYTYIGQAKRAGVIAPPDMTRLPSGAGWRYTWGPAGVSIALDRLHETRRGIEAELTVDCTLPDMPARLHGPTRQDLLSTPARVTLARYLGERLQLAWNDLLETAFRLAIEAMREGEPPVMLRDAVPTPGTGYAIDPLVLSGDPTLFFAKGGSFKSWLALLIAADLDAGGGVLPLTTCERHTVAYLDWEWEPGRHQRRLALALGDRLASCGILYRRMAGSLAGQVDQLARMIHDHGVTYIIVDSIALACGDDPEKASAALPFANAVRALGVGSLWIGHVPKHGDEEQVFGSAFWRNSCRAAWQVSAISEPGAPVAKVALTQRKVNDGPPAEPISLALDFRGGGLTVTRTDIRHDADFQALVPPRLRVLGILEQAPARVPEIVAATGIGKGEVEKILSTLARARRVVELSDGRWGRTDLAPASEPNGRAILTGAEIAAAMPL